jgi:hypothetical protein
LARRTLSFDRLLVCWARVVTVLCYRKDSDVLARSGAEAHTHRISYAAFEGVQFHDILYKTFRDILYTPGRRHRSPSGRKKPAREGEGWLGERKTWKSSA